MLRSVCKICEKIRFFRGLPTLAISGIAFRKLFILIALGKQRKTRVSSPGMGPVKNVVVKSFWFKQRPVAYGIIVL